MKKKKHNLKRIAVLTGGGDCPGLNAAIRAVAKTANKNGIEVLGVQQGFKGFFENQVYPLHMVEVSGIMTRGGTILKSSRFNPFRTKDIMNEYKRCLDYYEIDALAVIGGDGSLGIALDTWKKLKFPVVGIPKTIDNDVYGTDFTIGFQTAVQTAVDAIDKLHTTAESHDFIMVVEVMGRHCGYIAGYSGLAGGADFVMTPEKKVQVKEIVETIKHRLEKGKNSSIIVVAEDAKLYDKKKIIAQTQTVKDEYGKIKLGGVGWKVRDILAYELGVEARCAVLGHVQRGGTPTAFDRVLATQMGYEAVQQLMQGNYGKLIAMEKGAIVPKDLAMVRKGKKRIDSKFVEMASTFYY